MSLAQAELAFTIRRLRDDWGSATAASRVRLIVRLRRAISLDHSLTCATLIFPVLSQLLSSWETHQLSVCVNSSEELAVQIFALVVDVCAGCYDDLANGSKDFACNEAIILGQVQKATIEELSLENQQGLRGVETNFADMFLTKDEQNKYQSANSRSSMTDPMDNCSIYSSELFSSRAVEIVRSSLKSCRIDVEGSIAHVLQICREALDKERSITVRVAALLAIRAVNVVSSEKLMAAFVPGLSSALSVLLCRCRLENSKLAVIALDTLCRLWLKSLPRTSEISAGTAHIVLERMNSMEKLSNSTFAEILASLDASKNQPDDATLEIRSQSSLTKPRNEAAVGNSGMRLPTLKIERDASWTEKARNEISRSITDIVKSKDGPSYHAKAWARQMYACVCGRLLASNLGLSLSATDALLDSLAALRSDDNPDVVCVARMELDRLMRDEHVTVLDLRAGIQRAMHIALMRSAGPTDLEEFEDATEGAKRSVAVFDPDEDQAWVRQFHGFFETLEVFSTYRDDQQAVLNASHSSGCEPRLEVSRKLLMQVVSYFDISMFVSVLVRLYEVAGEPSPSPLLIASSTFRESRAVNVCETLGRCGLLSLLHAPLLSCVETEDDDVWAEASHWDVTTFLTKRNTLAVLEALVVGALKADHQRDTEFFNPSEHKSLAVSGRRKSQTAYCALELLRALSTLEHDQLHSSQRPSFLVDQRLVNAKIALLHSISRVFATLTESEPHLDPDYLLEVFLSLLQDAALEIDDIRQAAFHVLAELANLYDVACWRDLLHRHLNFIVSRVLSNLEHSWTGPVLRLIIGNAKDTVCQRATAMVESTLLSCSDDLAGCSNNRAIDMVRAIQGILEAGMDNTHPTNVPESRKEQNETSAGIKLSQSEKDLQKCLMSFCTDDVFSDLDDSEGVDEKLSAPATDAVPDEKSQKAMLDDEDESERMNDPLTRIASNTLAGCCDLLVGRPLDVRAAALQCATRAVTLLANDEVTLLPHIATVLPMMPEQFVIPRSRQRILDLKSQVRRGLSIQLARACAVIDLLNEYSSHLQIFSAAADLLSAMVLTAGSFVQGRFIRLIFPSMEPLLELLNVHPIIEIEGSKRVHNRVPIPLPSFAALNAADSVLQAVSSIAKVLPSALDPFAAKLVEFLLPYLTATPSSRGQFAAAMRRRAGSNAVRERYETERFDWRCARAHEVVEGLVTVTPDIVWYQLVQADASCPALLVTSHASLSDIPVRGLQ